MVGDDDIGSLCLQMFPPAHFKSKTQEILHMTNQEADNPEGEEVNYSLEHKRLLFSPVRSLGYILLTRTLVGKVHSNSGMHKAC